MSSRGSQPVPEEPCDDIEMMDSVIGHKDSHFDEVNMENEIKLVDSGDEKNGVLSRTRQEHTKFVLVQLARSMCYLPPDAASHQFRNFPEELLYSLKVTIKSGVLFLGPASVSSVVIKTTAV